MLWSEGTTVDYFERSLHSAAEIKPKVCAELIYGHGVERLQCTTSSWDGMRGKGSRRAEACLLIGRIFVTSFNRNRKSPRSLSFEIADVYFMGQWRECVAVQCDP